MYKRIRDLREDRDLLQKELADYLHCSQVCYSNYEMGKRDIPTEVLIKLCQYHNTSRPHIAYYRLFAVILHTTVCPPVDVQE